MTESESDLILDSISTPKRKHCKITALNDINARLWYDKFITFSRTPAVTANVQVGDGPVAPTFNVGGQFDPNSNSGIPVAPVVGTGLK